MNQKRFPLVIVLLCLVVAVGLGTAWFWAHVATHADTMTHTSAPNISVRYEQLNVERLGVCLFAWKDPPTPSDPPTLIGCNLPMPPPKEGSA